MIRLAALASLIVAAILLALAAWLEPESLLRGWLTAWLVLIAPGVGAIFVAFVAVLAPGPWADKVWGPLEALLLALPVVSLGVIPVLFALETLYTWADPGPEIAHWVEPRGIWQSPVWFAVRQIVVLAVLSGAAVLLAAGRLSDRAVAGALAIPVTLAASLFAFDIAMSLDPAFNSTIYGLYVIAGQVVAALAVTALARMAEVRGPDGFSGRPVWLLFGAAALWASFAYFQYLVIWTGDLPRNAAWYLARNQDAWLVVIWLCTGLTASAFALLVRLVRKSVAGLAAIAIALLAAAVLETVWRTAPDLSADPSYFLALAGWSSLTAGLAGFGFTARGRRGAAHA